MEIERLRGVEKAEQVEKDHKQKVYAGKDVIIEQIKDREVQRMIAKEEQFKEAQQMIKHAKQLQLDEQNIRLKQIDLQRQMQDEILEANQKAIEKKAIKIQREKEEDNKIMKYNVEKAQKEAEFVAEQK